MKQITQNARTGKLCIEEVPVPQIGDGEILVKTYASLISSGTERMVVEFAKKTLAGKAKVRPDLVKKVISKAKADGIQATIKSVLTKLDDPIPLGYSAAGKVLAVGNGVEGHFQVDDRVAICGAGIANHSEVNVVPKNLAVPIPLGVDYDEAAFGTMGAIALHAIRNLDAKLGEVVAIFGAGIIGQLAAQILKLSGVRAILLDYDQSRLNLAKKLGAEKCYNLSKKNIKNNIYSITSNIGVDGIIIATSTDSSDPFVLASEIARDRARVCMVGTSGTKFPYSAFMKKEMSIIVSRSYGPGRYDEDYEFRGLKYPKGFIRWTETENLNEIMRLLSPKNEVRLKLKPLITHQYTIADAEKAYNVVLNKTIPQLAVILNYPRNVTKQPKTIITSSRTAKPCTLGVIGAGNFARSILLPELMKLDNVTLKTIVTKTGISANFAKETFGFEIADTDENKIFKDKQINGIIIATRHDNHAKLTAKALKAGKSVLVEKPLGLNNKEINLVRKVREKSRCFFQVGFNRRFAPSVQKAIDFMKDIEGPRFMIFRINAPRIESDSWIYSKNEGGGRIIGEICHFVDLARHFSGSRICSVQAYAGKTKGNLVDDITATFQYNDDSLATIAYTTLGDQAFPKERFEIFCGNSVITIDNFRSLGITSNNTTKNFSYISQDKGFKGSILAFTEAIISGGSAPINENELFESTTSTFAILESLRAGQKIIL